MANKQCSVSDCENPVLAKSFCSKHYNRFRKRGDPQALSAKSANWVFSQCSIDGCERFAVSKTYCGKHYQRFVRTGSPLVVRPRNRGGVEHLSTQGKCIVDGCEEQRRCRGYCGNHYYRAWRHGDPLKQIRKHERAAGEGTYNNGYHFKSVRINGRIRQVGAHRLVMEEKLGRKLRPNENVHHVNGDRSDNRAENLELWVKSQPCGQRPEDLVAWAKETIRLYGDEVK